MTYDELIELLDEREWPYYASGGAQVRTFCPVCEGDDSNSPSMAVKRARDGEALLYCFSGRGGCGLDSGDREWEQVEAVFEAFASAPPPRRAGRTWKTRTRPGRRPEELGAVVVAEYDYGDARKVRYEWPDGWRKDFRWVPRKPGPRMYRPPSAGEAGRVCFLVEGEKDVDRLRSLGLVATTASEGHLTPKLARALGGSTVAVVPDYDQHGRRAAEAAEEILERQGTPHVRVDLGLEWRDSGGEDVSDWLDQGGTAEELKAIVTAALEAEDPPRGGEAPAADLEPAKGWKYTGEGMARKRGKEWEEVLNFQVVVHGALADERGIIRAYDCTFRGLGPVDTRVEVEERFLSSQNRSGILLTEMRGPALTQAEAGLVADFLAAVRATPMAREAERVITESRWDGGQLIAPGAFRVAPGRRELAAYGDARGGEAEARRAWREIVETAQEWPRQALALGMPVGAMFVERLRDQQLFTLHVTGESHTGKSETAAAAMAALGDSRRGVGRLYRNWNMSDKAPGNVLKQVGIMPVWFDEAANDEREPEAFSHMLFNLMEGRERRVAGTDGRNVAGEATWTACVLSTGEARLVVKSGLTGFRRRVMELYAPVCDDRDAHDRVFQLALDHHGWPLRWLAEDPDLEGALRWHSREVARLGELARGHQVEVAQAVNVATCGLGFWTLARLAGAGLNPGAVEDACEYVFGKLLKGAEEEGEDVGVRGLRALQEAIATQPLRFPEAQAGDELGQLPPYSGILGWLFDDGDEVGVPAGKLAEILGGVDLQTVVGKWKDMGVLVPGRKRDQLQRRVSTGTGERRTWLYVVRLDTKAW